MLILLLLYYYTAFLMRHKFNFADYSEAQYKKERFILNVYKQDYISPGAPAPN